MGGRGGGGDGGWRGGTAKGAPNQLRQVVIALGTPAWLVAALQLRNARTRFLALNPLLFVALGRMSTPVVALGMSTPGCLACGQRAAKSGARLSRIKGGSARKLDAV